MAWIIQRLQRSTNWDSFDIRHKTSPRSTFTLAISYSLVLSRSRQCFGFVWANQIAGNHIPSSCYPPHWTKLWSLNVVWRTPDWTILCSLLVKIRSIRVFEYSVILVGSFMICLKSPSIANDFSNVLEGVLPSWSMLKSPSSTIPFFSRSIFAKEVAQGVNKVCFFQVWRLTCSGNQKRFALRPVNFDP